MVDCLGKVEQVDVFRWMDGAFRNANVDGVFTIEDVGDIQDALDRLIARHRIEAERAGYARGIEDAAKVAHGAGLTGILGDWDKGWNYACVTIGQRIRAKGQDDAA